jgi:DNA-binding PadR family transcriptional regulator
MFDQGDLRFVILQLIADKPRHGYEIIKAIEERFGGMYSPSPGVIYPTLTLLEELGYVTVEPAGSKKLYTITAEGTAFLDANRASVEAVFERMARVGQSFGGAPAPEIIRAMQNLRFAVSVRIRKEPLSPEQVRRITEVLDAAAAEIERG